MSVCMSVDTFLWLPFMSVNALTCDPRYIDVVSKRGAGDFGDAVRVRVRQCVIRACRSMYVSKVKASFLKAH